MRPDDARTFGWLMVALGTLGALGLAYVAFTFAYTGRPQGDDILGPLTACLALSVFGFGLGLLWLRRAGARPAV